jgi:hypothetical protein
MLLYFCWLPDRGCTFLASSLEHAQRRATLAWNVPADQVVLNSEQEAFEHSMFLSTRKISRRGAWMRWAHRAS